MSLPPSALVGGIGCVTPLGWLSFANYAEKVCPNCENVSSAQKSVCPVCSSQLEPRIKTRDFKDALRAGTGAWAQGHLSANRGKLFAIAFVKLPDLDPFIETQSCILLLKPVIDEDLPRIKREISTLARDPDFAEIIAREGVEQLVDSTLQGCQGGLSRLQANAPKSPPETILSNYKSAHTEYTRQKILNSVQAKNGATNPEDRQNLKEAAGSVASSLQECTTLGDTLTSQETLNDAGAQFWDVLRDLTTQQITPDLRHLEAEWLVIKRILCSLLNFMNKLGGTGDSQTTQQVDVTKARGKQRKRFRVFQVNTKPTSSIKEMITGNKKKILATILLTAIASSAIWAGGIYLMSPLGLGIPVPATTAGSIHLGVSTNFFVELRNQSDPLFYQRNTSLTAIALAYFALSYSSESYQQVLRTDVDLSAYIQQKYGANAMPGQAISFVSLTGSSSLVLFEPPNSNQQLLPSINGRFMVQDVPASQVEAIFVLEVAVDMGNYTTADLANHYFAGLSPVMALPAGTTMVTALRNLEPQFVCTGSNVTVQLLSVGFDIGEMRLDESGYFTSWARPPVLTSMTVMIAGVSRTFSLSN